MQIFGPPVDQKHPDAQPASEAAIQAAQAAAIAASQAVYSPPSSIIQSHSVAVKVHFYFTVSLMYVRLLYRMLKQWRKFRRLKPL